MRSAQLLLLCWLPACRRHAKYWPVTQPWIKINAPSACVGWGIVAGAPDLFVLHRRIAIWLDQGGGWRVIGSAAVMAAVLAWPG
jgi:hypothetical protein